MMGGDNASKTLTRDVPESSFQKQDLDIDDEKSEASAPR